ncbi:Maf family protein [Holospora undulata]|uniref:Maf-like protein n=1 Tax=Holospora undulata HU1 TaxID=1321371 RepID=A0A061JFX2_9PROT|nr:Maf family protein [Holospora undulata]ETZ04671.1 Maf-like protein [Holospora undulata HU1]
MVWNFVTECEKKVNIIDKLNLKNVLGDVCILEKSIVPFTLKSSGFCDVLTYLKDRITFQLHKAKECRGEELFWSLHTLIFTKRSFLEGHNTLEQCVNSVTLWSGGSHKVCTMIGKIQNDSLIKFRLSTTKVKFKRIPKEMIIPLAESMIQESYSGGYQSFGLIGQYIRHFAGPVGGCEGVPLLPLIHFLGPLKQDA